VRFSYFIFRFGILLRPIFHIYLPMVRTLNVFCFALFTT
jgi:hypothetical protein